MGRESSVSEIKVAVTPPRAAPFTQEAFARNLALEYQIAGKTVRAMIDESDVPADSSDLAAALVSMTAFTT